jgi:hypothetical protein
MDHGTIISGNIPTVNGRIEYKKYNYLAQSFTIAKGVKVYGEANFVKPYALSSNTSIMWVRYRFSSHNTHAYTTIQVAHIHG